MAASEALIRERTGDRSLRLFDSPGDAVQPGEDGGHPFSARLRETASGTRRRS